MYSQRSSNFPEQRSKFLVFRVKPTAMPRFPLISIIILQFCRLLHPIRFKTTGDRTKSSSSVMSGSSQQAERNTLQTPSKLVQRASQFGVCYFRGWFGCRLLAKSSAIDLLRSPAFTTCFWCLRQRTAFLPNYSFLPDDQVQ